MLELLSPAGSPEAAVAAVQNGADAIYLGCGDFNARRNAANFSQEQLAEAVRDCHLRGVKVYLTLNTLLSDRELPQAADLAVLASGLGADAVLVQDLGVLRMVRQVAPDLPVHASTQMTIHSLDGAMAAAELGIEIIGTTLAGYTAARPRTDGPDLELLRELARQLPPTSVLVAEGRVHTPLQAADARAAGAFAVVVGTAITHPTSITGWFRAAVEGA